MESQSALPSLSRNEQIPKSAKLKTQVEAAGDQWVHCTTGKNHWSPGKWALWQITLTSILKRRESASNSSRKITGLLGWEGSHHSSQLIVLFWGPVLNLSQRCSRQACNEPADSVAHTCINHLEWYAQFFKYKKLRPRPKYPLKPGKKWTWSGRRWFQKL